MLMVCGEDLYEKKAVSSRVEEVLKTLVWYGIFNAVVLCALLLFGLDETSLMPHELILNKPVVLLNPICSYTCLFFALVAYKYVGVSVRNTFANVDGLFYILLLVIYHVEYKILSLPVGKPRNPEETADIYRALYQAVMPRWIYDRMVEIPI